MAYKILTKSEYNSLKSKYDKHNRAFEIYRKKTGRNWINDQEAKKYKVPEGTTNEQTSEMEIYQYKNKPLKKGEKYFAYLSMDGKSLGTFQGDKIADVYSLEENKSRGYNKKYSFKGRDINGKHISGRAYAGKGGYVRFHID